MRVRVDQAIVSGRELKIVANRRRKIYKTSPTVRRRDVRYVHHLHHVHTLPRILAEGGAEWAMPSPFYLNAKNFLNKMKLFSSTLMGICKKTFIPIVNKTYPLPFPWDSHAWDPREFPYYAHVWYWRKKWTLRWSMDDVRECHSSGEIRKFSVYSSKILAKSEADVWSRKAWMDCDALTGVMR